MVKPKQPHRRDSLRLYSWDYSSEAWYFITICTKNRQLLFGDILADHLLQSPLGNIAREHWSQISERVKGIQLDEFVIMPNHLHGIIMFQLNGRRVGALHATPLRSISNEPSISQRMAAISPKPGSLAVIIRSYKSSVTRWARRNGYPDFAWQRGYHDHIIRDGTDLSRIRRYIRLNPMRWSLDLYHHAN